MKRAWWWCMRFDVRVKQLLDGSWQARYLGGKVESLAAVDPSREVALQKLRDELRYHLEYCP